MESLELKNQLDALASNLEGKTSEEIKSSMLEFATKNEQALELATKAVKEEMLLEMKKIQDHADALDVKLQAKAAKDVGSKDSITELVTKNFDSIKVASKSTPFELEVKDMTLPVNLSGDQPRDYNSDVVIRPGQSLNVADLAQTITISGGTYTYTRSALSSGAVALQTEGALKEQLEYTYTMVDANTDYIAGFSVYSKKMRNNLPFLQNTLSSDLRNDYYRGENTRFQAILAAQATASSVIITGNTLAGMLVDEMAALEENDFMPNVIVVRPADWYTILKTPKDDLQAVVTFEGGVLRINGVQCVKATWLPANKYYVGNWSRVRKVVTEGFSFTVSEDDSDNFRKNNITAKVEAQVVLTVEQPDALVYGDFTAVA